MVRLFRHEFSAMGCPCALQLYAASEQRARRGFTIAEKEARRLDRKYSHYRKDGLLVMLQSRAARPGGVAPDRETSALLDYADTQFNLSGGLFDITSGALSALWDRIVSLPDDKAIARALEKTGWDRVGWDGETLRLPEGMTFDFGGVVKEYAADRISLLLSKEGFHNGYVDLGGDLSVIGPHPEGSPWRAGIRNPNGSGDALASVEVSRGGLATSGDYERCSDIDGIRYGHIINPKTGWPVSQPEKNLTAVSVLAPTCLLAGSLTTLAVLAGSTGGLKLLEDSGLPWLAIANDGKISGSGIPRSISRLWEPALPANKNLLLAP
jgi:thiamine biosynthesis lipoprotein